MTLNIIENSKKDILAIIVTLNKLHDELNFITPQDFGLQVGYHNRNKDVSLPPHNHPELTKIDKLAVQEVFYIKRGKVKIDIYDIDSTFFKSVILEDDDLIILNTGHGVTFLEKTEMLEIKQGPYRGKEYDKTFIKP